MMLRSKQSIEEYTIRKIQIYLEFLINNIAERHKNEKNTLF